MLSQIATLVLNFHASVALPIVLDLEIPLIVRGEMSLPQVSQSFSGNIADTHYRLCPP